MTTLNIKITKEILKRSKHCVAGTNSKNCAISVALQEIFPKARVGFQTVTFAPDIEEYSYLPSHATTFVLEFDTSTPEERENMEEFQFDINIPDSVIETINIDDVKRIIENSPHLELV